MEDHSSSSPPSPKRLTTEQELSGSAVGESESTHVSSPRMLLSSPPPPPPTIANPISGSESPFDSNYRPSLGNSTMIEELGHQENPNMHQDLPPSNPLSPPNNTPEIQGLGTLENPTHGTSNPFPMPTSNVHYFTPQTQTQYRPYGTWGLAPAFIIFSNAFARGLSAVNIQGDWRLQQQQPQAQRMITTLFRPQRVLNNWVGPEPGVYLLNVAVTQENMFGINLYCMGAVIRDHMGVVQAVIMRRWDNFSAHNLALAEYSIYLAGIIFSLRHGYYRLIAQTESHPLDSYFNRLAVIHRPPVGGFSHFESRYISRNCNSVAHMFAKRALWLSPAQGYLYWNEREIARAFGSSYMPY